jgi:hypothetical protein
MPHYFIIVHNRISEFSLRGFITNNMTGGKGKGNVISIPYDTPTEKLIDTIELALPKGVSSNTFTFFAEANFGAPSSDTISSALFAYLMTFVEARIIAYSSTFQVLLNMLRTYKQIEVMPNGEEMVPALKNPTIREDYSERVVTRKSLKSPELRRLRALTEGSIQFQPELPPPILSLYESRKRTTSVFASLPSVTNMDEMESITNDGTESIEADGTPIVYSEKPAPF